MVYIMEKKNSLLLFVAILIIALFAFHKFYFHKVTVTFEAITDKAVEFQVFYTSSIHKYFNESDSVKLYADASEQKEISIDLPTHKLRQFRLDFGANPQNIIIKNLKISGLLGFQP